jgi:hypothetical protein
VAQGVGPEFKPQYHKKKKKQTKQNKKQNQKQTKKLCGAGRGRRCNLQPVESQGMWP